MTELDDPLEYEPQFGKDSGSREPPQKRSSTPVARFLEGNSELFAVIGVFAAVTASIPRIAAGGSSASTFAVFGGLSLFLLTGVVMLGRLIDEASFASSEGKLLRTIWYLCSGLSFLVLAYAVIQAIQTRQEGVRIMSDIFGIVVIGGVYYTLIRNYDPKISTDHKLTQKVVDNKNYISMGLVYFIISRPDINVELFQAPYYQGVIGVVLWHAICVFSLLMMVDIIDAILTGLDQRSNQVIEFLFRG